MGSEVGLLTQNVTISEADLDHHYYPAHYFELGKVVRKLLN